MGEFLAYRILEGKLMFERCPKRLKPRVKEILTELGYEHLAVVGE